MTDDFTGLTVKLHVLAVYMWAFSDSFSYFFDIMIFWEKQNTDVENTVPEQEPDVALLLYS